MSQIFVAKMGRVTAKMRGGAFVYLQKVTIFAEKGIFAEKVTVKDESFPRKVLIFHELGENAL